MKQKIDTRHGRMTATVSVTSSNDVTSTQPQEEEFISA